MIIAAVVVGYLAVVWRVIPWFLRVARTYGPPADDMLPWAAALLWPVTLVAFIVSVNLRALRRAVESRVTQSGADGDLAC